MITRVHGESCSFYGIRKMHAALVREPLLADRRSVARCTTQRLMAESGLPRISLRKVPARPSGASARTPAWFNHRRLPGEIGLIPPVEYETQHRKPHLTEVTRST